MRGNLGVGLFDALMSDETLDDVPSANCVVEVDVFLTALGKEGKRSESVELPPATQKYSYLRLLLYFVRNHKSTNYILRTPFPIIRVQILQCNRHTTKYAR